MPKPVPQPKRDLAVPDAAQQASMLALGDSYTIGEQVRADQRWPVQLAALLVERGVRLQPPLIVAQTGWTGDELEVALDAADDSLVAPPYALVSLLIGVNDQYRGRSPSQFEPAFARLLKRAIGYAGGEARRVLVLSIPDWGITPFAAAEGCDSATVSAAIDAYNALSRSHCEASDAAYVDITDLTRQAQTRPELLAADGLHPSGLDYQRWALRVEKRLRQLNWPFA